MKNNVITFISTIVLLVHIAAGDNTCYATRANDSVGYKCDEKYCYGLSPTLPGGRKFVIVSSTKIDAARILAYFPLPSLSHQIVFRPLTQEMAKRGHQVKIITTDSAFDDGALPPNISEIDVHDKSYEMWKDVIESNKGEADNAANILKIIKTRVIDIFEYQINTEQISDIFDTKKFDLILVEACVRVALVIKDVFKAPTIQVSSLGSFFYNNEAMGIPSHPTYYPDHSKQRFYNLSIGEKLDALIYEYENRKLFWFLEKYENAMIERNFGPITPKVAQLVNNVDTLLLNVHPLWANNRPVPPNVIYVGRLNQQSIMELPKDLQTYLDSSRHGVIYMSFGTNADPAVIPNERIQIFCKVFSRLQYDVLWKWNSNVLPGRPKNVKIFKWLPQSDLLRHPKIKIFITQGGLQSTDESISSGVPLIAFPMLADQWYNAEQYVYHNIGLKMDLKGLTEDMLEKSIKEVINDPRYRDNVKRLGVLMRDQPQRPLERAVWWTEYVLRHGGAKHLRSPAANISWTEYLVLDVVAFLFIILVLVIIILVLGTYYINMKLRSISYLNQRSKTGFK